MFLRVIDAAAVFCFIVFCMQLVPKPRDLTTNIIIQFYIFYLTNFLKADSEESKLFEK